jgi:LysR family transcriptional activator of nhaA
MDWLNYHHLFYFWTVARAGSIARASRELRLSQPTISNQIKTLEAALGHELFQRQGRSLVLTDVGRTAARYADEIFRTGRELVHALKGLPTPERMQLVVGVTDVLPKLVVERLLHGAVAALGEVRLICREGPLPQLMAALAVHELDVVLADAPAPEDVKVKAFTHLLRECGVSFLAARRLAGLRRGFPASLDGAPALLPSPGTAVRRALDAWLDARQLRPVVVGEFDDSALLKAFGAHGHGFFVAPSIVERETCAQHGVVPIGRTDDLRERFYAISVERRLRHPGVVAIAEAARGAGS